MGSWTPSRPALLSALLSGIVMLIQLEGTKSLNSGLPTPTGLPLPARGHLGRAGENSTDEGGLLRTFADATDTAYPETTHSGQTLNTEMPFLSSAKASAQEYTELDVSIKKDNCTKKEDLCATVTIGSTLSVTEVSPGGTLAPETYTAGADLVTVPPLSVQYTDTEGVRHTSLEATPQRVNDKRIEVLEDVVTQPEELRTSLNDGRGSPKPAWSSPSEKLAIGIGSFLLALSVFSVCYQFAVDTRAKRMQYKSCSVYVIQNDVNRDDLEANNSPPETRF